MKRTLRPELAEFVANQMSAARLTRSSLTQFAPLKQQARGDVIDWKGFSTGLRKRYGLRVAVNASVAADG